MYFGMLPCTFGFGTFGCQKAQGVRSCSRSPRRGRLARAGVEWSRCEHLLTPDIRALGSGMCARPGNLNLNLNL